jgi:rubrerythrin
MRLVKVKDRIRRDFTGVYECESCGAAHESYGYDDRNFHHNVIPNMKCPECGESTVSLGLESRPRATKYPDWQVV